jgi:hypothetical protein
MTVKVIRPDGREEDHSAEFLGEPPVGRVLALAEIPQGYLEIVRIIKPGSTKEDPETAQLVVHESGLIERLPFNSKATDLYHAWSRMTGQPNGNVIVGTVVYLDGEHVLT